MLSLKDTCIRTILNHNINYNNLPKDLIEHIQDKCYDNVYYECKVDHVSCLIRLSCIWKNNKDLMTDMIDIAIRYNSKACYALLMETYSQLEESLLKDAILNDRLLDLKELRNQRKYVNNLDLDYMITDYAASLGRLSILAYLIDDLAIIYPSFIREVITNDHSECLRYLIKMKVYCVFNDVISFAVRLAKENNSTRCLSIL